MNNFQQQFDSIFAPARPAERQLIGGLWVITAIVGGNVEEFAGFRLSQAIELFYRAQARAGSTA